MDDLTILRSPKLWPDWPYLRVERRAEGRGGQSACFVRALDMASVEPVVYVVTDWPPMDQDASVLARFNYGDFQSMQKEGWRVAHLA